MTNQDEIPSQRLAMLKLLLIWEGRLNRRRVMDLFGLQEVRASVWIREFREQHPYWIEWNTKTRSFHATAEAYRDWRAADPKRFGDAASLARYVALVGLPHATGTAPGSGLLTAFPDYSTPSPQHFAVISDAIRLGRAVQLTYRSMQHPKPHKRTIFPHSLVRAGRRWHVRAWCDDRQDFRDFTLGRIADAKPLSLPAPRKEEDDVAWMTEVPVRLVAHPELTSEQQEVVSFEFFRNTSSRVERCRGALVSYFIQDMRAATDPAKQRPPDYQLAVGNLDEVKPWMFPS
jgi:predicted DNA-binding transcriptional regulator YafY